MTSRHEQRGTACKCANRRGLEQLEHGQRPHPAGRDHDRDPSCHQSTCPVTPEPSTCNHESHLRSWRWNTFLAKTWPPGVCVCGIGQHVRKSLAPVFDEDPLFWPPLFQGWDWDGCAGTAAIWGARRVAPKLFTVHLFVWLAAVRGLHQVPSLLMTSHYYPID